MRKWLRKNVEEWIRKGADVFYLGGYGTFDTIAAAVVWELKIQYPHIMSILILPYLDQKVDASIYDRTIFPPLERVPRRYAISHRNRWMVEQADIVFCYVTHGWGGAAKAKAYAQRKACKVIAYQPETPSV